MNDTANDHLRLVRRDKRLGPNPSCLICGFDEPTALEAHHIAGRRNDPDRTVTVCRNHHALVTEELRVSGVPMGHPSTTTAVPELTRLAAMLGGLAAFLRMIADALAGWAEWLHRLTQLGGDSLTEMCRRLPDPGELA